jgi:hypothetical protein
MPNMSRQVEQARWCETCRQAKWFAITITLHGSIRRCLACWRAYRQRQERTR